MRVQKYILSVIPIILLNIIYFFWQPFNKHLLPLFVSENPIADSITNIIYYILWIGLIILISETCFNKKYEILWHKSLLKKIVILIVLQIISDLIKFLLYKTFETFIYNILSTLLDIIIFALMMAIILKATDIFKSKKLYIFVFIIVAAFCCYLYFCTKINDNYMYFSEKYLETSEVYLQIKNNIDFLYEIISCLFETIIFVIIYTALYFLLNQKSEKISHSFRERVIFGLRIFLIGFGLFFISNVKALFIPYSFFSGKENISTTVYHYELDNSSIDFDIDSIYLGRYTDFSLSKKNIFNITHILIKYQNVSLNDYFQLCNSDPLNNNLCNYKCAINFFENRGIKFKIYGDEIIGYAENGIPYYFFTKDVDKVAQNDTLIRGSENLISNGDWNYFEHFAGYLLKYDPQFIEPYITKYSSGDFSESEKQLPCNADINTAYIQKIAKSLIE